MDSRTGEPITAIQAMNGEYIWNLHNPLYFTILEHHKRPFTMNKDVIHLQIRFNHNLRKALGLHKCFINLKIWTGLQPQTLHFLRVFKTQIMKYINQAGIVTINIVIRAINHVLWNVLEQTVHVDTNYDIKFNLY
ncbi:REn [Vernonia crinkle virus]|uniref:Replication enhancer n=1 Tax=Vernonia crinkle virus TaxID=1925153 RepID=A0A1L4AB19_9GEMI|nr:REn [Vernonia crinkle virus]API65470.1 REn [Vernonia crinkle virus]API65477.1 REn [Vernonia crinkle virus]